MIMKRKVPTTQKEHAMVINTLDMNIIRHCNALIGVRKAGSVVPIGHRSHTPQDPDDHRARRVLTSRTVKHSETRQDELSYVNRLRCDVQLLTGNLDQDIAILDVIA